MYIRYVTTRETTSQEDLKKYTDELLAKINTSEIARVDVIALPVTQETTVYDTMKSLDDNPLILTCPGPEKLELQASFWKLFHGKDMDSAVLAPETGDTASLSMIFILITKEAKTEVRHVPR